MMRLGTMCGVILLTTSAVAAELNGNVQWARQVKLAPPVSGVIARVDVDVGMQVKKDQPLLALDAVPFTTRRAQAEAAVTQTEVARAEAKRDLAQAEELYKRTVLSTVDLENAKNKYARSEAAYKQARAQLTQAQYELNKSILRAPFAARVIARNAEPGQTIATGLEPPVLFILAAQGEYAAVANVSVADGAKLNSGDAVTVIVDGQRYSATVRALTPMTNGNYEIRAAFRSDRDLRIGQAATIAAP